MKKLVCTLVAVLGLSLFVSAQSAGEQVKETFSPHNMGFSGGWVHITGNQGLDGFDVSGELVVVRPVSIAFDYDSAWDTSTLGTFQTTALGLITTKSHLQDLLIGPRIYLPELLKGKAKQVHFLGPFVEVQFGESNLSSKVQAPVEGINVTTSATAFSWELGGGGDFRLNPRWAFRAKADYLRTHLADMGQNRFRFSLGLVYTVRRRDWAK
jgi:opacity protein-like surface antigen